MQFIFGDNTSKYTLLFCDDQPESAAKIKDMVKLPYSPSPVFDSFGFIPFGINNNRALFVKLYKDMKMVRNVYVLHGIYNEPNAEYFFGEEYLGGVFADFVSQEQFDTLRDGLLAGQKDFQLPYSSDTKLAAVPAAQIQLDPQILTEILAKLYQRMPIVLVMDDEKYSNDGVRLLIKKIFSYLTPSLRKLCSYITAVDNVGSMEFLLRIIPRSMHSGKGEIIDLDAPARAYKDKSIFPEVAEYLQKLTETEKQQLFHEFELLYYGRDSIYKKQNFERFYLAYVGAGTEEELWNRCDEILGEYLLDSKCAEDPVIPEFLRRVLTPGYMSEQVLDDIVIWKMDPMTNFDGFCDKNYEVIKKVYYLCNQDLGYFKKRLEEIYVRPCKAEQIPQFQQILNNMRKIWEPDETRNPRELAMLKTTEYSCRYLSTICEQYEQVVKKAQRAAAEYINRDFYGQPISVPGQVVECAASDAVSLVPGLPQYVSDIHEHLCKKLLNEEVAQHNAEWRKKSTKEKNERTFKAFTAWMREKEQQEEPEKEGKPENKNRGGKFAQGNKKPQRQRPEWNDEEAEETVEQPAASERIEPPKEEDIAQVATDPELRPKLASVIAWYIMNVAGNRGEQDFVSINNKLIVSSYPEVRPLVAEQLCAKKRLDLAVLYLAAYGERLEQAVEEVMALKGWEELAGRQVSFTRKTLAKIIKNRLPQENIQPETKQELLDALQEVVADKEGNKQQKAIYKCLQNSLQGKMDGIPVWAQIAVVAVCGVICALALILLLAGMPDKGGDDPSDSTSPSTSEIGTVPEDPTGSEGTEPEGTEPENAT